MARLSRYTYRLGDGGALESWRRGKWRSVRCTKCAQDLTGRVDVGCPSSWLIGCACGDGVLEVTSS